MKSFFVSTFFIFIVYSGCKPNSDTPCRTAQTHVVDFSADETAKFHFAGHGDTIRYINVSGDSICCFGAYKFLYYQSFPIKNNPDCVDDSVGFSCVQFYYADTLSALRFTATATHLDSMLTFNVNNSLFKFSLLKVGLKDSISWFDSLQFGNRKFYNINSYTNSGGDSLYYNSSYGMIAFKQGAQRFYLYRFNNY